MVDASETNVESEVVSGDKDCFTNACNQTDTASSGDQRAQLDAKTDHSVDVEGTPDSFTLNDKRRRYEEESGDKSYLAGTCNQAVTASLENQESRLEAVIQHDVEEESTLDSSKPDHNQRRDENLSGEEGDEKLSGDKCYLPNTCNEAGAAPSENQQFQLEAVIKHDVEKQSTLHSVSPVHSHPGDEGDYTQKCYRSGIVATENQLPEVEAETKHNVEVQSTLNSVGSDHIRSGEEKLLGDKCEHIKEWNHTGIAVTGNQVVLVEAETKSRVEEQSTLNNLSSSHVQSRDDKLSGEKGDHIKECNHSVISTTKNQQAHVEAEIKHNREVQNSSRSDPIQNRDEKLSGEKGDHAHECNHTGIAAKGNGLPQVGTKSKHDIGVNTTSDSDQLQNALALLYRKRQELVMS